MKETDLKRIFCVFLFLITPFLSIAEPAQASYNNIDDIRNMPDSESGKGLSVRIRGVVTFVNDQYEWGFIQDESAGIFVFFNDDSLPKAGDYIIAEGTTSIGDFAPVVHLNQYKKQRNGSFPKTTNLSVDKIFSGFADSQWLGLKGYILSARIEKSNNLASLQLKVGARKVEIFLPALDDIQILYELIGDYVAVKGVGASIFNNKKQLLGIRLMTPDIKHIKILKPESSDPFKKQITAISDLLKFSKIFSENERIHIKGQIIHPGFGDDLYVQDSSGSIAVNTLEQYDFKTTDIVELVGFTEQGPLGPVIQNAFCKKIATSNRVTPLYLNDTLKITKLDDAVLLSLKARLIKQVDKAGYKELTLEKNNIIFIAYVQDDSISVKVNYTEGSILQLTGITRLIINPIRPSYDDETGALVPESFKLILRDSKDIVLIEPPPWLNLEIALIIITIIIFISLAAIIWIHLLRKTVKEQTQTIKNKLELEEALKEKAQYASKAKSTFLATMSHEIRTPMNGVLGMTNLMKETNLTDEQKGFVENIMVSGESLLRILNDILDFSKIEAERIELEITDCSLYNCIEDSLDVVAHKVIEKKLELTYLIAPNIPEFIKTDYIRLKQILVNLLSNAVKFTSSGTVCLEVKMLSEDSGNTNLQFSVKDTGIGMTLNQQKRLFTVFSQADETITRKFGGTGLGLAISKRLTELMDGKIWVKSAPQEGSTFYFTIKTEAGSHPPEYDGEVRDFSGLNCLVIDDIEINLRLFSSYLAKWNLRSNTFLNPNEGFEEFKKNPDKYGVVILDYFLPQTTGLMLAEKIKQVRNDIPILIASSVYLREKSEDKNINRWITKPIKKQKLYEALQRILISNVNGANQFIPELKPTKVMKKLRVLVAEDNIINQRVVTGMLQKLGVATHMVSNGVEVIKDLKNNEYDIILMDVQMPEMDGLDATRLIRANPRIINQPKIIALTANAMAEDRELCISAGMDDYLSKPLQPSELMKKLSLDHNN